MQAHEAGLSPEQVGSQLEEIGDAAEGVTLDLAWEPDGETGAPQYDVLVMVEGVGSFLLSHGPQDDRPWVLRGAHHWSAGDLVKVGDHVVYIEDAVTTLELLWTEPVITRQIVASALLKSQAAAMDDAASEAALTAYIDRFRRSHRLFAGPAFDAWLAERGLSTDRFSEKVRERAQIFHLRQRHGAAVPGYFAEHRHELDQLTVARWWFAERERAEALHARLEKGADLWSLMKEDPAVLPCLETCLADELPGEVRDAARSQSAVVGPLPARGRVQPLTGARWQALEAGGLADGFCVYRVVARQEASLDARTREAIEQRLFDAWLDRLRGSVPVQWNWGRRPPTENPQP
jgi:putative peptide maturation system protein